MIPDFQRKVVVWYMLMRIFTALGHRNVSHVNVHECAMSTVLHVYTSTLSTGVCTTSARA